MDLERNAAVVKTADPYFTVEFEQALLSRLRSARFFGS